MPFVETTQRLNIWTVLHAGGLAEGACTSLRMDSRAGLNDHGPCLRLRREGAVLAVEGGPKIMVIWQEALPLPDRVRPMFACPACDRPCSDLFLGSQIACRHCLGLKYRQPYGNRLYRMRRRLGIAMRHRRAIAAEVRLLELEFIRDGKRAYRG
jgi:hypothetical protein